MLNAKNRNFAVRSGLTLIELMLSVAILSFTVVALGMMLRAVEIANEYNMGYGTTAQHARVTMDRIDRAVSKLARIKPMPVRG